jgi:hypothetical protein
MSLLQARCRTFPLITALEPTARARTAPGEYFRVVAEAALRTTFGQLDSETSRRERAVPSVTSELTTGRNLINQSNDATVKQAVGFQKPLAKTSVIR